jgi:PEGA domain
MPEVPKIDRDARLRAPKRTGAVLRKVALYCATAATGFGTNSPSQVPSPAPIIVSPAQSRTAADARPLVLTPSDGPQQLSQHRSHASHSSHSSHYSSTGSSPGAPAVPTPAPSTPKPEKEQKSPEKGTQAADAVVTVTSTPDLGEIQVNGTFRGQTRSVIRLSPGTYEVSVQKKGYAPWTRSIEVTAGSELTLHAELTPAK